MEIQILSSSFTYRVFRFLSSLNAPGAMSLMLLLTRDLQQKYRKDIVIYYIDNDEIPGFFLCLKSDIFISHSEDIDVAMATAISTNNKRAFRLRARPLLLPLILKWLQVMKTVCDFVDELIDFRIDLFPDKRKNTRNFFLGYWQWPRWQVNRRRRKYKHEEKDVGISGISENFWFGQEL